MVVGVRVGRHDQHGILAAGRVAAQRVHHQLGLARVRGAGYERDRHRPPSSRTAPTAHDKWPQAAILRGGALGDLGRPGAVTAGSRELGRLGLGLRGLGALPRPLLVELDAPFTVLGLAHRQAGAEVAAAATAEAGHLIGGVARLDQLARDRNRQLLARFGLPDHEAATGILARPARIALAVLGDLVPAHRARPELGPRDPHVLQLLVQLPDGLPREARDVAHEVLARVLPALDLAQAR